MSDEGPGTQEDTADGATQMSTTPETPPGDEETTFPRRYVEELREESARYRARAQTAEEASARLMALTIASATREILADPTDLPISDELTDEEGWPDPEKIRAAAEDLAARKPHLRVRRPSGDIGQGAREEPPAPFSLMDALRGTA